MGARRRGKYGKRRNDISHFPCNDLRSILIQVKALG
jgi:hypothetical protein